MKNTAGDAKRRGCKTPKSVRQQCKLSINKKKETEVSSRLVNFVLLMYKHLNQEQRYAIYLGIKSKFSKRKIASVIGVSPSTLSREIKRNSNASGEYVWLNAQRESDRRKHGLSGNHRKPPELWWRIEQMIVDNDWSPAQIVGVLRNEGIRIAKQTIYNHVHADLSGRLIKHLPHELKYTKRAKALRPTKATNIANRTSIHERPAEADGKRFGDWEMDTIVDPFGHAIVTLTERSTNFILMKKLKDGRKAMPTAKVVARLLFPYREKVHTITTDNGPEFAAHLEITRMLSMRGKDKATVYFTDSYSSWQKGAIENANKLIRKYIPKKANFDDFSDAHILRIQKKLNARPREKLNFKSPKERFFEQFR